MRTIFLTAAVASFLGQQNVEAIKLSQKVEFIDDVVKMLAEAEEKDLAQEQEKCNPCYNSSWGPNPHYPFKGAKTLPNGQTEGKTTDYKGPVTSDANVPGGGGAKEEAKPALSQLDTDCNPCYTSNTGPNPHYAWKGNGSAKPNGSTSPPAAGGDDKKEEAKPAALSQMDTDCNPCPASSAGPNPHYPAKAAGGEKKEDDKKAAALSQMDTDCNPCPNSAAGKNPHYAFDPNAKPAGKEDEKKDDKKAALSQLDCNPCYVSNAGPNTHYDYEGNKKAVPFGTTVAAAGGKKEEKKEEAAKLQLNDEAYDQMPLNTYAEIIADAAEDNAPENPVTYS